MKPAAPGKKLALLFLLALVGLPAGSGLAQGSGAPVPKVSGNQLIDERTGRQYIPRGVNWPSFEYACVQGWGYSNPGADRSTAETMSAWGINTVRLPLNQDCWLGDDALPRSVPPVGGLTPSGYRRAIADFVETLNEAGIAVLLDLHWSAPPGIEADGLRPMPDSRSGAFWSSVANRFRESRSVFFDLFNEPHSRWDPAAGRWAFTLDWSCWVDGGCRPPLESDLQFPISGRTYEAAGMAELLRAVRSAGARQPVVLSGIDYANDMTGWLSAKPSDPQLVAGFHNYPVQRCRTPECWDREILPLKREVPVLAAEFGQNDCSARHLERFMNWADSHRIGYLAWAWWHLPVEGCSNYALIENLDGTPTRPYGETLRANLLAEAAKPQPPAIPVQPRPGSSGTRREDPDLIIRATRFQPPVFSARIRMRPQASRRVRVRLVARRTDRVRTYIREIKVPGGRAKFVQRLRPGWKPRQVKVTYLGDQTLRPATLTRSLPESFRGERRWRAQAPMPESAHDRRPRP